MRFNNLLLLAAVTGLMAGAQSSCGLRAAEPADKPTVAATDPAPAAGGDKVDGSDKHGCKGLNSCKGKGGCKTDKNGCSGQNACKGQGGCRTAPDEKASAPAGKDEKAAAPEKADKNGCKGPSGCGSTK